MKNETNKIITDAKKIKLEELATSKESYIKTISRLQELIKALMEYDKKTIDKKFFDKYFFVKLEYRDFYDFSIQPKRYEYIGEHKHEIYIWGYTYLEIKSRDRIHILEVAQESLDNFNLWISQNEEQTKKLEALDDMDIVKDLQAVFFKHGSPDLWGKILDSYEVKYPTK